MRRPQQLHAAAQWTNFSPQFSNYRLNPKSRPNLCGCSFCAALYEKYDVARLSTEIYLSDHHPAMTPSEAFSHIARRKTERVAIDDLQGRITTSLVTPYPPGIPLLIPGETFNAKIVDYLRFNREFARGCPGFETDVHGLLIETHSDGVVSHYADCVAL